MTDELTILQAAIAAIHNHLHAGNVNAAHEACECAMSGGEVGQPNITVPDSAKVQIFAARFNEMCSRLEVCAAFFALLPSATQPGAVSVQIGGAVDACKILEGAFQKRSVYQGEHAR